MEYTAERVERFKTVGSIFLHTIGVRELQAYGRTLQLREPSTMKKKELVQAIVGVLCGEIVPEKRSKQGAPIRNNVVNPIIIERMEAYKKNILEVSEEIESVSEQEQPEKEEKQSLPEQISPVTLKIEIQPSVLTKEQKKLFNEFINSL